MWLGRYSEAEQICIEAEAARPENMSASCFPIQRGMAQWCLGRFGEANKSWQSTSNVNYADTAGANVHFLLLLAADGLAHGALPVPVRTAMEKKSKDSRTHHHWPGPIALYLLGVYGASMVIKEAKDLRIHHWQFSFYSALKAYSVRGEAGDFLKELADLSVEVAEETDLRTWVDFARQPEVYMARELPHVFANGAN